MESHDPVRQRRDDAVLNRGRAAMLSPLMMGGLLLVIVPLLMTTVLAFLRYDGLTSPEGVGFENFSTVFGNKIFQTTLFNSLLFVVIAVPVRLIVASVAALTLANRSRGNGAARALVYLPTVVPDIAYALLWSWVVNPITGPFAPWLGASLLSTSWGARSTILFVTTFQIGEAFLVAYIARRQIPASFYEEAAVEGASSWFTLRHVTLPVMAPVLALLAARDVVVSLQASFVPAMVITDSGPLYATTFLPMHAYRTGFEFLRFGPAAVMTLVALAISVAMLLAMGLTLRAVSRRRGTHLI